MAYEHYYRSVYGHFTKLVSRLGYPLPAGLSDIYDVRVSEASHDRLVISALSELDGRTKDMISIDQNYEVRASFAVPAPRPEYLKGLAFKQLRALRDSPTEKTVAEQGVYRGFFRFDQKLDSQDRKLGYAVGVKVPVIGVELELGADDQEIARSEDPDSSALGVGTAAGGTGQKPVGNVMSTLEEAYLAQRIFHAEVGRYAKNWSELSKIASFRFEDKAQFGQEGQVPFGDAGSVLEIDAASDGAPEEVYKINRNSARVPSSDTESLEIEAIVPEKGK